MTTLQLCQGLWFRLFTGSTSRLLLSINYAHVQVIIKQVYSSCFKKKNRTPFCVQFQQCKPPPRPPICYYCSPSPSLSLLHNRSLTCSSFPCLHPASSHYLTTSESPAKHTNCLKTRTHTHTQAALIQMRPALRTNLLSQTGLSHSHTAVQRRALPC